MKIPMDRQSSFESNISPTQPPNPPPDGSKDAIDALCSSGEQTYAQFMNNFITLTPADINPQAKVEVIKPSMPRLRDIPSINKPLNTNSQPGTPGAHTGTTQNDNEIEEEILDEGTKVTDVLLRKSNATVKVDNFIELDDEDDEIECDYSASFIGMSVQKDEHTIQPPNKTLKTDDILSRIQANKPGNEENLLDMIDDGSDAESMSGDEGFEPDFYPEQGDSISCAESDTDLKYDPKQDLPNPGEIEEGAESKATTNVHKTELPFTSLSSALATQQLETETASNNEVEDFRLDEDFDYDHVALSQKYPPEMRAMMPGPMGTGMK